MIKGTGALISDTDEDGVAIPFLTTEEILKQIQKFGFIVEYDVKANLPGPVISYLMTMLNLGYVKITRIGVRTLNSDGGIYIRPTVILMKDAPETLDLLRFDETITIAEFMHKLDLNVVVNVTNEPDMNWDWLTYMANIEDLLQENSSVSDDFQVLTKPRSSFATQYDDHTDDLNGSSHCLANQNTEYTAAPEGYTPYSDSQEEDSSTSNVALPEIPEGF